MELEFFDSEKHSYFLDEFQDFAREPSEDGKEFFEPLLKEIVRDISEVTDISTDFKLYFAMTDESELEDAPINRYVHGFSFAEWMEGFDRDVIIIRAVRDRENWKNCLINMLAHEMAHQEFYSKNQSAPYTILENLIFEGHAMNRAKQVAEELDVGWEPHYRSESTPNVDPERVINILDEDRSYEPRDVFQNGEEPCPEAEGYQIAYLVVKKLVNRREVGLDELPEESTDSLRSEIIDILGEILN